jgi:hypothetical protein
MLDLDRVTLCSKGNPEAATKHRRLVALITPLLDVHRVAVTHSRAAIELNRVILTTIGDQ